MMGVVVTGLRKRYGSTVAVDGLSLEFPAGKLSGFLGPNGAGKTTTFRILLGLTRPDEGTARIGDMSIDHDLARIVKRVGAIIDEPGLLRPLTGRQNLVVAAHTLGFGHERIEALAEFVELSDDLDRPVSGYSKGMRQRLALAAALLGDPDVLFLDEPLDGLDPAGQSSFKQRLRRLVDQDRKTVVISSHNLSDVQALADHVVVIARGALRYQGPLPTLLGGAREIRVTVGEPAAALNVLRSAGLDARVSDSVLVVTADDGAVVAKTLAEAGIYPSALVPANQSLEEVFLELTSG
ncbi:MAG: ABC transporter ATP-binding protein [Actinomycetes bacterium]|jgi:ABC-type multidrug transport system ATPase subunit|nr:ABC transporter ATP-binding protein [Acidimicrobiia bacterium]